LIYVPTVSVVGVGLAISNIAVRHIASENETITVQPNSGTHQTFHLYNEANAGAIPIPKISVDRVNDITSAFNFIDVNQSLHPKQDDSDSWIQINDASEFQWTTGATVGTYIFQRIGQILQSS